VCASHHHPLERSVDCIVIRCHGGGAIRSIAD